LNCYDLRWSPDGRYLAAKRERNAAAGLADVEVWDLADDPRRVLLVTGARGEVREFHPQRPQFLTGTADGEIVTWDLTRGAELERRHLADGTPVTAAYSPDARRLAAVHRRGGEWIVTVHDAVDHTVRASRRLEAAAGALAWHPEGRWLALTDHGGNVHLMEPRTGGLQTLGRHRAEAVTAAFAPSGDYLVTGGWERSLICWDVATRQRVISIELDAYHFRFRSDGQQCALLTPTGIQIHGFERPMQRRFFEDLGSRLRFAAFSADGRWLAASADERLGVWDLEGRGPGALTDTGAQGSPYWTLDGRELVASRRDSDCFRWRVHPPPGEGQAPGLEPMPIAQPEGFAWVSVTSNRLVWTTLKGTQLTAADRAQPEEDGWSPTAHGMNAVSPRGQWLGIYRGYTRLLHIHRLPELTRVATLTNQGNIAGFQFSPGEEEVAVASRGQVEFWSTRTWERTRVLTNFAGIPHVGLLVQPDGSGWWLAQHQRFACLHDPRTLEPRLPLPSAMSPLALSVDGRCLAVAAEARRLEVWDLRELRERLHGLGLDY